MVFLYYQPYFSLLIKSLKSWMLGCLYYKSIRTLINVKESTAQKYKSLSCDLPLLTKQMSCIDLAIR